MTAFAISSGHGKYIRGASGSPVPPQLDEVDEARRVVDRAAEILNAAGFKTVTFHDNTSHDQSTNLHTITNWHNKQSRDYDVSVHFNAYDHSAHGCEVLYVTQETLAAEVSAALADAAGFTNRGAKYRSDLYVLNNTNKPAVLIETCFCDNTSDSNKYNDSFEEVCHAIASSLSGQDITEQPPPDIEEPPPGEQPPPSSQTGTVYGLVAGDTLNIRASSSSNSPIIGKAENNDLVTVVSSTMNGDTKWYKLKWGDDHMAGVAVYGWASASYILVDNDVPGAESDWHTGITATEFGEGSDEQEGAYGDYITGSTRGVSFPYKWRDSPRPMIEVAGPGGTVIVGVCDVGPWNTDDPNYVLGTERPLAEQQYEDGTEAQNGQVPSNPAGIDLTAPIASEVGISGKGKVNWRFAPEGATMTVARAKHKGKHRA